MLRQVVVLGVVSVLAVGVVAASDPEAAGAAPTCRTVPVPQDAELRSDLARADFGVDGTGVTVGIISNTFAQALTNSTPAQNVADGLLPGPGNPCGYLTPVEVLTEGPPAGADDEGRGMAQIVHGVAPGARILFASGSSSGAMIPAMQALAAAGADIIVDDVTVFTEPWFQSSLISQQIDELVADGITYFSAAANETVIAQDPRPGQEATPVNGWRTDAFRPTTCPADVITQLGAAADCMDFRVDGTPDATSDFIVPLGDLATAPADIDILMFLQWAEPFANAQADFRLVIKQTGALRSDNTREVQWTVSPQIAGDAIRQVILDLDSDPSEFGDTATLEVSIARVASGAQITPAIAFQGAMNGPQWIGSAEHWRSNEHDTIGRTIIGHNGAEKVISVAATSIGDAERLDYYSSLGPVVYVLEPETAAGTEGPLPAPVTVSKPSLLSVDGIPNTVLGTATSTPGVFTFDGTSAATPNAGAVAALALQLDPSITPQRLTQLLERTARPKPAPYVGVSAEHSVGAGLIDAHALLREIAPKPQLARTGSEGLWPLALGAALLAVGLALRVRRRVRRG